MTGLLDEQTPLPPGLDELAARPLPRVRGACPESWRGRLLPWCLADLLARAR